MLTELTSVLLNVLKYVVYVACLCWGVLSEGPEDGLGQPLCSSFEDGKFQCASFLDWAGSRGSYGTHPTMLE